MREVLRQVNEVAEEKYMTTKEIEELNAKAKSIQLDAANGMTVYELRIKIRELVNSQVTEVCKPLLDVLIEYQHHLEPSMRKDNPQWIEDDSGQMAWEVVNAHKKRLGV